MPGWTASQVEVIPDSLIKSQANKKRNDRPGRNPGKDQLDRKDAGRRAELRADVAELGAIAVRFRVGLVDMRCAQQRQPQNGRDQHRNDQATISGEIVIGAMHACVGSPHKISLQVTQQIHALSQQSASLRTSLANTHAARRRTGRLLAATRPNCHGVATVKVPCAGQRRNRVRQRGLEPIEHDPVRIAGGNIQREHHVAFNSPIAKSLRRA